jgi:hypothetical protein
MVTMITTKTLDRIDIHPFDNDPKHVIEALQVNGYQRMYKVKQSSYSAHREALRRRRKAVRSNAKPWRRYA